MLQKMKENEEEAKTQRYRGTLLFYICVLRRVSAESGKSEKIREERK